MTYEEEAVREDEVSKTEHSPAASAATAQTLVAEWIDHSARTPTGRTIGQVAKTLKALLEEGHPYGLVRAGLQQWATRAPGTPAQLTSFVEEQLNPPTAPRWAAPVKVTPTDRAQGFIDMIDLPRAIEGRPA